MPIPATCGIHHLGLTVAQLETSAQFFTEILGWRELRRDDSYPAIFISDGQIMLSLWQARRQPAGEFDKDANIGLHHLALELASEAQLEAVYQTLLKNKIEIEFAPECLRDGPMQHMICYEPGGIRIEFIWPGATGAG